MKKTFFIYFFISFLCFINLTKAQTINSKANNEAVVISDNARFTILTPQLIRLEWSSDGKFEDKASLVFINRNTTTVPFTKAVKKQWLIIKTEKLSLYYKINSGKFNADNLYVLFELNGKQQKWYPGLKDSLNLKGTCRTLDATDGEKDVTLEDGLLSRNGWFLYDDSQSNLFDDNNWVCERKYPEIQDWYFFGYGHEYKKQLSDYTRVAGKIPMPPRYAFGYWWSRYWMYSDEELRKLIADMRFYKMPIDVLIIDMDWHNTFSLSLVNPKKDEYEQLIGWTGYSWNKSLFPYPQQFLDWTKEEKLKTALNLHPASGIAPMEDMYHEFAKAYGFDASTKKNIPFKIEEKKWVDLYFDKVLHPLEKQGIDFWWLDWQQWLDNKSVKNLSNTWWLNHVFFTDKEKNSASRPLIFHRWGGMGNHRYQIGFSGDTHSTWESLDYQSYFTANAANVGYGYWSHDIGGHMGDDADPELYLRWIQSAVFSPVFRTHCTKSKDIERRMFMYPDHFNFMLDALQMRYALNPYIYNAGRYAYETGVSICRPMYYDYPEKNEAYEYKRQYMFGNDMIIAPIGSKSENGLSLKKIWLPDGDWYELYTSNMLKGNKAYLRNYTLNEYPVFIKAGSIIPMYPKNIKNLQNISDTLILCFIPGPKAELRLYDDDGNSSAYKQNQYSYTSIKKEINDNKETIIHILPTEGNFEGMKTALYYELQFPSSYPVKHVFVNNKEYFFSKQGSFPSWSYDVDQLCMKIHIPLTSRNNQIDIKIIPQAETFSKESHIYGKIGLMNRLPLIIQKMKYALNRIDPFANLSRNIANAGIFKTNLMYKPENTLQILTAFDSSYSKLLEDVRNYKACDENDIREVLKLFVFDVNLLPTPEIIAESKISDNPVKVKIKDAVAGVKIYYTTDGSIPTEKSLLYDKELEIGKTCWLKARAFKGNDSISDIADFYFQRTFAAGIVYKNKYNDKYNGGNPLALADGVMGNVKDFFKNWIGFEGDDMIATIELKKSLDIKSITARFLESQRSWIFAPLEVSFETSSDGINFRKVFYTDLKEKSMTDNRGENLITVAASLNEKNVRFIRITAKNISICPDWHYGKGGRAWIFTDELIVE
ncbi:MAG: chitobiase/beta-hexosaminidase C-terminal domain-containing protein [Bacteroidetes bacterium]|nr:chitobiase/beta-hexosaminidase C-terminal domain-containing protein [Bacteroidota bacterium]